MIKSITVTNHLGDSMTLELMRPEKSGFIIKGVTGLGPVKANINTTSAATSDGSFYNSAFLGERDIILSLEFYETADESIEDLRQKSYRYFPNKKKISLVIETDNRKVKTEGIVEDNTPDIFSQREGCSITIRCPDPYLYSLTSNRTIFYGVNPMFEFEFSNESLTDPLLELGQMICKTEENVFYEGDCDVGVTITITAVGNVSNIVISNSGTAEKMSIDTTKLMKIVGSEIIAGDVIIIETTTNNKSIILLRDGITYNILNCLGKDIDWFNLTTGDNIFSFMAVSGVENIRFRIDNKILYSGV